MGCDGGGVVGGSEVSDGGSACAVVVRGDDVGGASRPGALDLGSFGVLRDAEGSSVSSGDGPANVVAMDGEPRPWVRMEGLLVGSPGSGWSSVPNESGSDSVVEGRSSDLGGEYPPRVRTSGSHGAGRPPALPGRGSEGDQDLGGEIRPRARVSDPIVGTRGGARAASTSPVLFCADAGRMSLLAAYRSGDQSAGGPVDARALPKLAGSLRLDASDALRAPRAVVWGFHPHAPGVVCGGPAVIPHDARWIAPDGMLGCVVCMQSVRLVSRRRLAGARVRWLGLVGGVASPRSEQ